MRPTLSALVRRVLLEAEVINEPGEHPLHDRAYEIASRLKDPNAMAAASSQETMIGRGGNATVHAIPGEEELVLRVLKSWREERSAVFPTRVSNPFGDMNVGQPLARVGNATVHLKQGGEPAGMTYSDPAYKSPDRDLVYARRIHDAASLSQDAYDGACSDLMRANELGYEWDPSKSNNILIDVSRDRLGLVDLSPKSAGSTYFNSAGDLIITLVGNTHAYKADESLTQEKAEEVKQDRARIVQLTVNASARVGLPMSQRFRDRPENESSLLYSLKLSGLDRLPTPTR